MVYGMVWGHGRVLGKRFWPHLGDGHPAEAPAVWKPRLQDFLAMEFPGSRALEEKERCGFEGCRPLSWVCDEMKTCRTARRGVKQSREKGQDMTQEKGVLE
jgi:hypothetical protein